MKNSIVGDLSSEPTFWFPGLTGNIISLQTFSVMLSFPCFGIFKKHVCIELRIFSTQSRMTLIQFQNNAANGIKLHTAPHVSCLMNQSAKLHWIISTSYQNLIHLLDANFGTFCPQGSSANPISHSYLT